MSDLAAVNAIASEIDRLVIRGHELAGGFPDKPPPLASLAAFPQLLDTAAIALLAGPMTRDRFAGVIPYTPRSLVDALIDNNVEHGIVAEPDGALELTEHGRQVAEALVDVQDAAVAGVWSVVPHAVESVAAILAPVVAHGLTIEPPRAPSNFALFAGVVDRPTPPGRTLRLITAVRYWRADAHLAALAGADLRPSEGHALNRLWDVHRGVTRPGQGFPDPGRKGVASLESRGLAADGVITTEGIALRERIEGETDRSTAPIYGTLDDDALGSLLAGVRSLPS